MNRKYSLVFTLVLVLLSILFIGLISDRPRCYTCTGNDEDRAVIAIRDDVNTFQKFGSRLFTYPYLNQNYNEVVYITLYNELYLSADFFNELERLLQNYEVVDIFILAHGNDLLQGLEMIPEKLRKKIRMVYNTGCGNYDQGDYCIDMGADAYVSHYGKRSLSPIFYFYFLRNWCSGMRLEEACELANNKCTQRINLLIYNHKKETIRDSEAILTGNENISIIY